MGPSPKTALPPLSDSPRSSTTSNAFPLRLSVSTGRFARVSTFSFERKEWSSTVLPGQFSNGTSSRSTGLPTPPPHPVPPHTALLSLALSIGCPSPFSPLPPAHSLTEKKLGSLVFTWSPTVGQVLFWLQFFLCVSSCCLLSLFFSHECALGFRRCCCGWFPWRCGRR